ncbi:MAG: hypothetical protein WAV78_14800 [Xanthobacteraceae bacterium]
MSERRNEGLPFGKKRTKNVVIETRLACVLRFRIGFLVFSLFPNRVSFNGYLSFHPIDEIALLCCETGQHEREIISAGTSAALKAAKARGKRLGKATLASLLRRAAPGLRFNEHLDEEDGPLVFAHACKMGLEGIVSKRKDSPYRSGRSPHWIKSKNPNAPAVKREAEEDWGKQR